MRISGGTCGARWVAGRACRCAPLKCALNEPIGGGEASGTDRFDVPAVTEHLHRHGNTATVGTLDQLAAQQGGDGTVTLDVPASEIRKA